MATPLPRLNRKYVSKSVNEHMRKTKLIASRALKYLALLDEDIATINVILRAAQRGGDDMTWSTYLMVVHKMQLGQEETNPWDNIDTVREHVTRLYRAQHKVEAKLKPHLEMVSGHECRALLESMQTELPRELRDMVYAYLCHQMGGRCIQERTYLCWGLPPSALRHYHHPPWHHLGKDTYQSADGISRREFVESWYRHTTLVMTGDYDVSKFFERDLWNTSLAPLDWLRHVEILITEYPYSPIEVSEAEAFLEQISLLRTRTEITICLELSHVIAEYSLYDYFRCKSQLRELFDKFKPLLQSGYVMFMRFAAHEMFEFKFKIELEELNVRAWCDKVASLTSLVGSH
jgi:hypothetical protein